MFDIIIIILIGIYLGKRLTQKSTDTYIEYKKFEACAIPFLVLTLLGRSSFAILRSFIIAYTSTYRVRLALSIAQLFYITLSIAGFPALLMFGRHYSDAKDDGIPDLNPISDDDHGDEENNSNEGSDEEPNNESSKESSKESSSEDSQYGKRFDSLMFQPIRNPLFRARNKLQKCQRSFGKDDLRMVKSAPHTSVPRKHLIGSNHSEEEIEQIGIQSTALKWKHY